VTSGNIDTIGIAKLKIMTTFISQQSKTYNFIDLFCGAGGFTEGFLLADHNRFRLIAASDINETSMLTHTKGMGISLAWTISF
jgi:DNA (cytosine-5)-methyltransferase 1